MQQTCHHLPSSLRAMGMASGFLAVIADISKRKKAEIDLKNQILFSRQIFQSIPEMIIIVDRRLRITFINKRTRDLIQVGGATIIGQNINFILARNSIESGFDELVREMVEADLEIARRDAHMQQHGFKVFHHHE